MLSCERLTVTYGNIVALDGVSLHVREKEIVSLLGANGAGKTTVLRSILGLTRPRRGEIRFRGQPITRRPTHEIARAGIGWVPDDRRLCPTLTVARNVSLGVKRTGFRPWSMAEVTGIFSPLAYLMGREAETLSGGEMQMVAGCAARGASSSSACIRRRRSSSTS